MALKPWTVAFRKTLETEPGIPRPKPESHQAGPTRNDSQSQTAGQTNCQTHTIGLTVHRLHSLPTALPSPTSTPSSPPPPTSSSPATSTFSLVETIGRRRGNLEVMSSGCGLLEGSDQPLLLPVRVEGSEPSSFRDFFAGERAFPDSSEVSVEVGAEFYPVLSLFTAASRFESVPSKPGIQVCGRISGFLWMGLMLFCMNSNLFIYLFFVPLFW